MFSILQALVDAPDMVRGQMNFKRLTLTDIKIDIKRVPNKKTLLAALEAAGEFYFLACLDNLIVGCVQMSRTNGRTVLGGESLSCRRREPHSMILTGSRSCWLRSR